jgi:hypothetical protein
MLRKHGCLHDTEAEYSLHAQSDLSDDGSLVFQCDLQRFALEDPGNIVERGLPGEYRSRCKDNAAVKYLIRREHRTN